MKQFSKKGFTLIELLVVITIIGILATWATAVYTSQIQKGRDATRMSSLEALRWWVEQYYQDYTSYPNRESFSWVTDFVPKLPLDPKTGQSSTNTSFDYAYNLWADSNWIPWQIYEISSWLENTWNMTSKAQKDWWNDNYRLEIWISNDTLDTRINWTQTAVTSWVWTWIPNANSCVTVNTATTTACTWWWVLVIR